MASKNNIRSIRFSDELAELIDRQAGDTFTAKFENLITRCVWELPRQEERLKDIQDRIKKEQQRLYDLRKKSRNNHLAEKTPHWRTVPTPHRQTLPG